LGSRAGELVLLARGIDDRRVEPPAGPKSIGEEVTFASDVTDLAVIREEASRFCRAILERVQKRNLLFRTVTLKVRFSNFQTITRSQSLQVASDEYGLFWQTCLELFERVDFEHPVRLLGVTVSGLEPAGAPQQVHFDFLFGPHRDVFEPPQGHGK